MAEGRATEAGGRPTREEASRKRQDQRVWPLRQEAQKRRQGYWEGGQVQASGWMQEAGARGQDPGARSNGPYEARRHKYSGEEVELIMCNEEI